jgi:hypothetical protein
MEKRGYKWSIYRPKPNQKNEERSLGPEAKNEDRILITMNPTKLTHTLDAYVMFVQNITFGVGIYSL